MDEIEEVIFHSDEWYKWEIKKKEMMQKVETFSIIDMNPRCLSDIVCRETNFMDLVVTVSWW